MSKKVIKKKGQRNTAHFRLRLEALKRLYMRVLYLKEERNNKNYDATQTKEKKIKFNNEEGTIGR